MHIANMMCAEVELKKTCECNNVYRRRKGKETGKRPAADENNKQPVATD